MKCPSCGKDINDMDMVCPNCGAIVTRSSDIFSKNNTQGNSTTSSSSPVNQGSPLSTPGAKAKYNIAVVFGALALLLSIVTVISGMMTMFGGLPEETKYIWFIVTIVSAAIAATFSFVVFSLGQSIYGTQYRPKGAKENLPVILAGPALFLSLSVGIIVFVLTITL